MIEGAFRWMKHDHYFRSLFKNDTEMKDVFRFAAPLPVLGFLADNWFCAGICEGCCGRETRL